ncbi:tumor necrosis factor ligand superfamily member 14 [Osmerus mordax]|uniref:tumor necrosis factor ligand superfamily member 14 n=1 Tax=Osmerus mordax TaxID=8014 RepID=UPI00350F972A
MAEGGIAYPSVFMVDSSAVYPRLPSKPPPAQQRPGIQVILFLLVSLALCGMVIEAFFIYHLYRADTRGFGVLSKSIQDQSEVVTLAPTKASTVMVPSKPLAHLIAGPPRRHSNGIMQWVREEPPFVYDMDYRDGKLVIKREGFYYVYSKLYFKDSIHFTHTVLKYSDRYLAKPIPLLQSQWFHTKDKIGLSNSYLGGVFQFFRNDSIFVTASDTSNVIRSKAYENYFGVVMIC